MNNPWVYLPEYQPFILPDEHAFVRAFNASAPEVHTIRLELMPEPYLGNPSAPIVLLNLNPSFMDEEIYFHTQDPAFISKCRANLLHEPLGYPFYLLDPELSRSEGHKWWMRKLRQPINISSVKKVANTFFCIELFPYHSRKYKIMKRILQSQRYSFFLLRESLERDALVILMRSQRLWMEVVPELATYPRFFQLNNPQNVAVSPGNCPEAWSQILNALVN